MKDKETRRREKQERERLTKVFQDREDRWKAGIELLKTRLRGLSPEGDYRNDVVIHPVLVSILKMYGFRYEQGLFWYRNDMQTHTYALSHLEHFVNYYLLDDGELWIEGDDIMSSPDDDRETNKLEALEWLLRKTEPVTQQR